MDTSNSLGYLLGFRIISGRNCLIEIYYYCIFLYNKIGFRYYLSWYASVSRHALSVFTLISLQGKYFKLTGKIDLFYIGRWKAKKLTIPCDRLWYLVIFYPHNRRQERPIASLHIIFNVGPFLPMCHPVDPCVWQRHYKQS